MKSFTMKALALAVLSFAGVGSAMAAGCPTDPFAAWSSDSGGVNSGAQLGGQTVGVTPGLNTTQCAFKATFATAPGSNGEEAVVFDSSPQHENSYRFRFYIDPTNIATSLSTINTVFAFSATAPTNLGTTTPTDKILQLQLLGSAGNVKIRTLVACNSGDGFALGRCKSTAGDLTLPAGPVRVEGQVLLGSGGTSNTGVVNIWIGTNVGTPDRVINVNNTSWSGAANGVVQATMGLFQSTPGFRTAGVNKSVIFDEFDSRRQTPIGP